MLDTLQIVSSLGVFVAALGAIVSVVMTYRMSVSVRHIEKKLQTKEGLVASSSNEEDFRTPALRPGEPEGDADE